MLVTLDELLKRAASTNDFLHIPELSQALPGFWFRSPRRGLTVVVSIHDGSDKQPWLWVDIMKKSGIPSYDDIQYVKKLFIGEDKQAIQVFPAGREYSATKKDNIAHLFSAEFWRLPEFPGLQFRVEPPSVKRDGAGNLQVHAGGVAGLSSIQAGRTDLVENKGKGEVPAGGAEGEVV